MRLSIVSDEVSFDLETALEVMQECHCKEYVLRHLGLDAAPLVDERWIMVAEKALQLRRFRITAIEADLFTALENVPQQTAEIFAGGYQAGLFILARRLQCSHISVVPPETATPNQDDPEPPWRAMLRNFCTAAAQSQLTVLYKTQKQTIESALAHLAAVGAPNLALDWDIVSAFAAGDDTGLEGVELALPHLKCVRVRDAIRKGRGAEAVSLGKGVIPWEDILELLYAGGYRGPMVLEPAVTPKLKESRAGLTLLGRWIDACRIKKRPGQDDGDDERSKPGERPERQRHDKNERAERPDRPGRTGRAGSN